MQDRKHDKENERIWYFLFVSIKLRDTQHKNAGGLTKIEGKERTKVLPKVSTPFHIAGWLIGNKVYGLVEL